MPFSPGVLVPPDTANARWRTAKIRQPMAQAGGQKTTRLVRRQATCQVPLARARYDSPPNPAPRNGKAKAEQDEPEHNGPGRAGTTGEPNGRQTHPASTNEQQFGQKRFQAYGRLGDEPAPRSARGQKASTTSPPKPVKQGQPARPFRRPATRPTHGNHALFTDHATTIGDIRRQSLHVGGYAVRYTYSEREKRWKVFVRLARETYGNLRAQMLVMAIRTSHRSSEALEQEFRQLHWQPYEPVRQQLATILKAVNRRRRYAGYPPVSPRAIPKSCGESAQSSWSHPACLPRRLESRRRWGRWTRLVSTVREITVQRPLALRGRGQGEGAESASVIPRTLPKVDAVLPERRP